VVVLAVARTGASAISGALDALQLDLLSSTIQQKKEWRMAVDINMTQRGMRHRPAPQPLRRELAHVLLCGHGLVGAEGLVLLGPRA
jgi:hypothetical protein